MSLSSAFRNSLLTRRLILGLTQADVAERMGVTQSTLSDLENGRYKDLRLGTLESWARALGLDIRIVTTVRPEPVDAQE